MTTRHGPRVSVGIPVYNGGRFLAATLDSLLAQTLSDFELIISDNASTDDTQAICRAYAARDARVQYFRNSENLGVGHNYRRLVELSRGELFKWAAADDLCAPAYLARCVEVLDAEPTAVLAYARARFIDEDGHVLPLTDPGWDLRSDEAHERFRYVIHAGHWVNSIYGVVRRDALTRTRLIRDYPGGDYCFLGELSLLGKLYEIPDRLFSRRLHRDASSQHGSDVEWTARFFCAHPWRARLPCWNRVIDHLTTILKSRLCARHKLSLVWAVLRLIRWQRRVLAGEIGTAVRLYARHRKMISGRQTAAPSR